LRDETPFGRNRRNFDHHHLQRRNAAELSGQSHPLATQFDGVQQWVAGAHATNASTGIIRMAPGHVVPTPYAYSTEHMLVHFSGALRVFIEGETYDLEPHDILFIPAFMDYGRENPADEWNEYLSINLRYDEWPGRRFLSDGSELWMRIRYAPDDHEG
jgi:mannose-6-phosphate isomerase-like protein (cupin superfamily)